MLEERPVSSCRLLCRHFPIGKATYLWILHNKLGLKRFHLRWVPHVLSINQKSEMISYSKLILTTLMEQKVSGFQWIVTRDESWFLILYPHGLIWVASREELLQHIKQKIDTEECLASILWW
jgi:hypothetical protein